MERKNLKYMPYARAYVVEQYGCIKLYSYTTNVLTINQDGWLIVYGLYSQTTRRHISAFMKEYTKYDYKLAKRIYENEQRFNIYSGEYAPLYCESEDL